MRDKVRPTPPSTSDSVDRRAPSANRRRRFVLESLLLLAVTVVSIAVSLLVAPMQEVSALGQTVQVGVAAPSLSWSGPAELDLFGQRIPTTTTFVGPVRPRLQLTHITVSRQLADLGGGSSSGDPARGIETALIRGFRHYVYWQVAIVAVTAALLMGAICGWRRRSWRATVVLVVLGVVVAEAVDLGAIMITAYSTPAKLRSVHSLEQLVGGTTPPTPPVTASSAGGKGAGIVVLGDSTAAGLGNPLVARPSATDRACRRSGDSYPVDLGIQSGQQVTSLACSGATIAAGVLGAQQAGNTTVAAQFDNPAVAQAGTIVVGIGANDVEWSDLLRICAVSKNCDNAAEQAYFQSHLATLSSDWLRLMDELHQLPKHPKVVVNLYYDPFEGDVGCLQHVHVTDSKLRSMLAKLATLNSVLSQGAQAAGFATALPNFAGHGVCADVPYVQGLDADAPFHPTAAGGLAIALADAAVVAAGS